MIYSQPRRRHVTAVQSEIKGMTVFNTKQVDTTKGQMFFGPPLGVQRYDKFKYPIFDKLTQTQLGFFWRQKKYLYKKIDRITRHLTKHRNISSHQILSIRFF